MLVCSFAFVLLYCMHRLLSQQLRCYVGFTLPLFFREGKAGSSGGISFQFGSCCTHHILFVYNGILHFYVVGVS